VNSRKVEQQALYVIIKHPATLSQCNLVPEDFTHTTDQMIFDAMLNVAASNSPVDLVTISEYLEHKYREVDMRYLGELVENGFGLETSIRTYCDIIKKASRKRQASTIARNLQQQLEENYPGDPIAEAITKLMAVDKSSVNYSHTLKEALVKSIEAIQKASEMEGIVGIPTGLTDLDDSTGGFHNTDLTVIGARPAMGKTALLLGMCLASNKRGGVISAEQGAQQAASRFISMKGSLDSQKLRTAQLSESEWSLLSGTVVSMQELPIYINDQPAIDINALVRQAREWKFNEGLGTLKNLARELQIPIVALAQVKREVDSRTDRRPQIGDMSDASEIEKEADVIMTLYREDAYDENAEFKGLADLDVVKNRHGPTGTIRTKFIGKYFQFKDLNHSTYQE
jgi:replicative DNA helicase